MSRHWVHNELIWKVGRIDISITLIPLRFSLSLSPCLTLVLSHMSILSSDTFYLKTPFQCLPLCYYNDNKNMSINSHMTPILYIQKEKCNYHMNYAFIGIDE